MYLTSFEEESLYYDENNNLNKDALKNAWKGYLFPLKYKNKSVALTK